MNQAVILAGGLGTRLGERTRERPKSLLPVGGRPFIFWQLERLAESGFHSVLLCIGYLGEMIRQVVGDGRACGVEVHYSEDGPRLLGTAGALRRALPQLRPTFLLTYGDSYLPFDYGAPLRDLEAHPEALGTMSVYRNCGRWDASNAALGGELVVYYAKGSSAPRLDYIDYGALALRREVVESIPEGVPACLSDVLSELACSRRLRALEVHQRFYQIGSEAGLRELDAKLGGAP